MDTQPLVQSDLAYSIEKPDWVALRLLIEEIEEELSRNRRNLLYCLSNWFLGIAIFRRFEERQMVMNEPTPRDREYHRVILTGLLAGGEKLLHEITKHDEIETVHVGIELVDVQASVNEMRLKYAEWFGDMKEERKSDILREAFGVKA